jgi:hypothetical protein
MRLIAHVGDIVAERSFVILESEQITATQVSPKHVTIPIGDTQIFSVTAINQFGFTEMQTTEIFEAHRIGDYELIVSLGGYSDTAYIHVVDYANLNLALGKPAACSGYENVATKPENATDGDLSTRWSSRFQDGEWITVDLGKVYLINRVKLYWETAYATHFDVQISEDGVQFTNAYTDTNAKGGIQDLLLSNAPVQARYVRILCHARSTNYGSSLYEIEVYGVQSHTDVQSNFSETSSVKYVLRNGQLYIVKNGIYYTISGAVYHK